MDCDKSIQLFSSQQSAQAPLVGVVRRFLSEQETAQIIKQFRSENWIPNGQVLWSGMSREKAQDWADKHQLQTLTTAMGPLMDEKSPECSKSKKTSSQWSRYVHGASAIFAWRIAQGERVLLLSPPPPERFHPSGLSYYQLIEEPIIRGLLDQNSVQKIFITHPMIQKNEDEEFYYELWPNDKSEQWVERFGSRSFKMKWRQVGHSNDILKLRDLMTSSERRVFGSQQFKRLTEQKNQSPRFISFDLSYSLIDKLKGDNNAIRAKQRTFATTESTSTVISPENTITEKDLVKRLENEMKAKLNNIDKALRLGMKELQDELKKKRKSYDKAQKKAQEKLKNEGNVKRKAFDKVYQDAIKRIKEEVKKKRKSYDKTQKKAMNTLNQKGEAKRKALDMLHREGIKKLKDEIQEKMKAIGKVHQEAMKKVKDELKKKRIALDKTHQDAIKKIKDEAKARKRSLQEAKKNAVIRSS